MVLTIFFITSLTSRLWICSSFRISITKEVCKATFKHRLDMAKIVSKMTNLWTFLNHPGMIQDDPRWIQKNPGSFLGHQSSTKKLPIWRLGDVQKTPPRSHMNPQNHPKIQKSFVLAHNIHTDCFLGVARGFFVYIWCEALSSIICSEGPEGENPRFNSNMVCRDFQ